MEWWQTVLLALGVGLAGVATTFFTGLRGVIEVWFKGIKKQVSRQDYAESLKPLFEFYRCFESIRSISHVGRIILWSGKNCGGLPCPGKPYTVKAVDGWSVQGEDAWKKYDFDLSIDQHYVGMLQEILTNNVSIQHADKMPSDSKLKRLYEDEGVKSSRIYYLGIIGDVELLYISIASYSPDEFSISDITKIDFAVDKLRSLLVKS